MRLSTRIDAFSRTPALPLHSFRCHCASWYRSVRVSSFKSASIVASVPSGSSASVSAPDSTCSDSARILARMRSRRSVMASMRFAQRHCTSSAAGK